MANDKLNDALGYVGNAYDAGAVVATLATGSATVAKGLATHNAIISVPLQAGQVIAGYAESEEEGNVQLGGAVGSLGGGVLGGVIAGALLGAGATVETGPGAVLGGLVGGIVGGMIGEPGVEALVRSLQAKDITSPTITVSVGAGRGVRAQTIPNPDYVGPLGNDSPSEHILPNSSSPKISGPEYSPDIKPRIPGYDDAFTPTPLDRPSEYQGWPSTSASPSNTITPDNKLAAPDTDGTPYEHTVVPTSGVGFGKNSVVKSPSNYGNGSSHGSSNPEGGSTSSSGKVGGSTPSASKTPTSNGGSVPTSLSSGSTPGSTGYSNDTTNYNSSTGAYGHMPIILDLAGNGISITELSRSQKFVDSAGDGLSHRTAWAGVGNAVLFFDPDGRNAITEDRQYIFTEWDPTAKDDLAALKSVFDTDGDGKLTSADAAFANFKLEVTNADGTTSVVTLAQAGITSINLTADATRIVLPDGSIINGQSTYTKSDGSTGTLANAMLVSETEGHRVVQTSTTDGSGNHVVDTFSYNDGGHLASAIHSVTSSDGSSITNCYDDNGDGVWDRLQTITKVTNGDGSKTETLTNKLGGNAATAVLQNMQQTITSADGKLITINRDSQGGGWFDQKEVRTTNSDGSRAITITDLTQNNTVLHSQTETLSVSGMTRTIATDADGNGTTDTSDTHAISIDGSGIRTETVTIRNGDASLRLAATIVTAADGKSTTSTYDLDGNGTTDRKDLTSIVVNVDGSTTSSITIKNGDNSVRSTQVVTQSADTLTKVTASDVNGDGVVDANTNFVTTIASGVRTELVTITNNDSSIKLMDKMVLAADKVSSEHWVDLNHDGVFQTTDKVSEVTVDSGTGLRTENNWARNADGSVSASSQVHTSADGLTISAALDADGDGDTDTASSDITTFNVDGSSTETIVVSNGDASLRAKTVIDTSANGLTTVTKTDVDGNGTYDRISTTTIVKNSDGSTTSTITDKAGNTTTLLDKIVVVESADRLTKTVTSDSNGDGANDLVTTTVKSTNGSVVQTTIAYDPNGSLNSKAVTSISANGLVKTTQIDSDGDGVFETVAGDTITLNSDGSRTEVLDTRNADGSLRTKDTIWVSDDGLQTKVNSDLDGNGTTDHSTNDTSVLLANGAIQRTIQSLSSSNVVLSWTQTTTSADGLSVTTFKSFDGDTNADFKRTDVTTLNVDGSRTITSKIYDVNTSTYGTVLRSAETITISNDGRTVTTAEDVNGDGNYDWLTVAVEQANGTHTKTVSQLSATGAVQSKIVYESSANGLSSTTKSDYNGDSVVDIVQSRSTVLNADGSNTTTSTVAGNNGTIASQTVATTSANGLVQTSVQDWNGDGLTDLTQSVITTLNANGSESTTFTERNRDNSLKDQKVTSVSADHRTVSVNSDTDGNGVNDRSTVTTIADSGVTTRADLFYSTAGTVIHAVTTTTSSDGLSTTIADDQNADGRVDLTYASTTTRNSDGSVEKVATFTDWYNKSLGSEIRLVSGDGLSVLDQQDTNGDGIFDFVTTDVTSLNSDGSVARSVVTRDGSNHLLSQSNSFTSGNGLSTSYATDFNGDGGFDRIVSDVTSGEGSSVRVIDQYDLLNNLIQKDTISTSADGLTVVTQRDSDGNGINDLFSSSVKDLSGNFTTTSWQTDIDSDILTKIISTDTANGMSSTTQLDIDGNGSIDITRNSTTSFDASGNTIVTFTENYGASVQTYKSVTVTSANGFVVTQNIDVNGDGVTDETRTDVTQIAANGIETETSTTLNADGSLREKFIIVTSADGRTVQTSYDKDGNGLWDRVIVEQTLSDGQQIETSSTFGTGGYQLSKVVTTTSADGLHTTIARSGTDTQTIDRTAVNSESYVWDNHVTPSRTDAHIISTHSVDQGGNEVWSIESTIIVRHSTTGSNGNVTYTYIPETTTKSIVLDQYALDRVVSQAERTYDAVLDRDMTLQEKEQLINYITNSELDGAGLAADLSASSEFTTKYGTLDRASFINQIYWNALGRAPSLYELNQAITDLKAGTVTQAQFAANLAESLEHQTVGNGHIATTNSELDQNAPSLDRLLDPAMASAIVTQIVDVVYDRAPTVNELEVLTDGLLHGTTTASDIATILLGSIGDLQGVSLASLRNLSGAALVDQAFLNALGRHATAAESDLWSGRLTSGDISTADFVAALAQSPDHLAVGNGHLSNTIVTPTTVNGTSGADTLNSSSSQNSLFGFAGNDTLNGGAGADRLVGGTGVDSLKGGGGSDRYEWSKGDGNDTIDDSSGSIAETDVLALLDVNSTGVQLSRSGNDLKILVTATGEIITDVGRFASTTSGKGIDVITFADGVTWALSDILSHTKSSLAAAGTLNGSTYGDNLYGTTGNDILDDVNTAGGNDFFYGGKGNDTLYGDEGSDTYIWAKGDGNDRIEDNGASQAELDSLVLLDVTSSDVALTRANGSNDLKITIVSTGEIITITNRFASATTGTGIEQISFSDGVVWTLPDILSHTSAILAATGTLNGTSYADNFIGTTGNDTLDDVNTAGGDDFFYGGKGNDTLYGDEGSDTYVWSKGDGNDTIGDGSSSLSEVDTLVLTDVNSTGVTLVESGSSLLVKITATGETITVSNRFASVTDGRGIEVIKFADGVTWSLADIIAHSAMTGTASAETLSGTNYDENIYGLAGNDTINGNDGNDVLVGGTGVDTMNGGNGSDVYLWTKGDGDDTIDDNDHTLSSVDTLVFTDAASAGVTLAKAANGVDLTLTVAATGEVITVLGEFESSASGRGLEVLKFSDGVTVKIAETAAGQMVVTGTSAANTLSGWNYSDIMSGLDGNDTINGNGGADTLIGGKGVDTLNGGTGSDSYVWSKGDGNDVIADSNTSLTDIDTLILQDVLSSDVALTRSGNNLVVTVVSTGEALTVNNRFYDINQGQGIEQIQFSDGEVWLLQDVLAHTATNGTSGVDTLSGTAYADNLYGLAGNDTINGNDGNDTLIGGLGNDTLNGGNGSDRYLWSVGDGNDTIGDTSTSLTETDVLSLLNVAPSAVVLTEVGANLNIAIGSETLVITNRFASGTNGRGIDAISFGDGTTWYLQDILNHTSLNGTAAVDTLSGSSFDDNIFGFAGNDTINGNDGDDKLVGGLGVDTLNGGNGNDTYVWASGDGNDIVNDTDASMTVADSFTFTNVASTGVTLSQVGNDLKVTVIATGETITLQHTFDSVTTGHGIETLNFSDGVSWTRQDMLDHSSIFGTSGNDTLSGTNFGETLRGLDGNDTLNGNDGNDTLYGGAGNDILNGGNNADILYGEDGNDTFNGDAGPDTMDGGAGVDTVSYSGSNTAMTIDLYGARGWGGNAEGDVYANIENATGGNGNDTIYGTSGTNILDGQSGNDRIVGGAGSDTLIGGMGADVFVFTSGFGVDVISDFHDYTQGDKLEFSLGSAFDTFSEVAAVATQVGSDVVLTFSATDKITIQNFQVSFLGSADMIFT